MEVLVVVVILGILAGISMRVVDAKEKAYIAAMKSDLRNVMTAQIAYFEANSKYAPSAALLDFNASAGVVIIWLGGPRGYTSRAIHTLVAGAWFADNPYLKSQRRHFKLRAEVESFLALARELNAAADPRVSQELNRVNAAMHESVDRMAQLAGKPDTGSL